MIDSWVKAMMATPPQICGRRLLPFSIGHYVLLREMENAILTGEEVKKGDLFAAIFICSKPYQDALRIFVSKRPTLKERLEWFWMRFKWGRKSLVTAWESFGVYMDDFIDSPRHANKSEKSRSIKSDAAFYMIACLMSKYNICFNDAVNTALCRARCLISAYSEMEGDDTLLDQEETQAMNYMDEGVRLDRQGDKQAAEEMYQKAAKIYEKRRAA